MRWILISIWVFLAVSFSFSQDKVLTESEISKIHQEVDYTKTKTIRVPKKNKSKISPQTEIISTPGMVGGVFKYLGILLLIILGIIVLYLVLKDIRIKKEIEKEEINLDQIQDIKKVDFDDVLQGALDAGDYRLAMRIKFLTLMKALATQEILDWKVYKTNRQYLSETKKESIYSDFEPLVRVFEHYWYGSTSMSQNEYMRMYRKYDSLIKKVNRG